MKTLIYFSAIIALFLIACKTDSTPVQEATEDKVTYVDDNDTDALIAVMELEKEDQTLVKSLMYVNDIGETASVFAYLDKEDNIKKIEESRYDPKTATYTYQEFYLKNGVIIASKRRAPKSIGTQLIYSEEVSYYDEKGNILESKDRAAKFEELLASEIYKKSENKNHSSENAFEILKQVGTYSTTFRGFASSGPYEFIIVGGPNENDFYSSLSIQEPTPTIRFLKAEGKKALSQELRVSFERFRDPQGYEMQILQDLAILKDK